MSAPQTTDRLRPLAGVRVLEDSHTVAGAHAGKLLRQLGATVVVADRSHRSCGACDLPADVADGLDAGKSAQDAAGGPPEADIVVTDEDCCLRGGAGESPARLAEQPRIEVRIQHASSTDGPGALVSSLGACAESGVAIAIGRPDLEPLGLPPGVAETVAGTNAVAALLAAWLRRDEVAGTTRLTVSTADCLEFFVGMNSKMYDGYPREWTRSGRRASGSAGPYPAAIFRCKDGFVGIIGRSRSDWQGLLAAMGDPEWAREEVMQDPWYVSEHLADEVDEHVQAWTEGCTEAELIELALVHGFVIAPIRTLPEVLAEPQHEVRGFWETGSQTGRVWPGSPFRVTPAPASASVSSASSSAGASETGAGTDREPRGRRSLRLSPDRLLEGVRVLDLSWVWAGPMVTMILADLGAEVIKVEHPNRPDGSRTRGRPTRDGLPVEGPDLEVTPYFHQVNHGKLSLGVDLKDQRARDLVREVARSCDVVVENMRPGVMRRLGLGFEELSADNERLVMLSMTLAGQEGPLSQLKGYAPVMGGLSGLEGLLGYPDDDVTGMYTFSFCDPNGASYGLVALLAALEERERTGRGAWIDLSQIEAAIAALPVQLADPSQARPTANHDDRYAFQATVRCAGDDAWLTLTAATTAQVSALEAVVGETEELERALGGWAAARSASDAARALRAAGVPCAPVARWTEVVARRDRHGPAQSQWIHHPYGGSERIHTPPWRFDGVAPASARRGPLLGEHTRDVVTTLTSLDRDERLELERSGVLWSPELDEKRSAR